MKSTTASAFLAFGLAVQQAAATVRHLPRPKGPQANHTARAGPTPSLSLAPPIPIMSAPTNRKVALTGAVYPKALLAAMADSLSRGSQPRTRSRNEASSAPVLFR